MTGMARCKDIELLLGAFEDGELEPHEMQEVARHTATCTACDGVLADYRSLAVGLRSAQPIPNLDHFADGVMARIRQMHLPTPVPEMKRHWYDTVSDWFANTILTGGLAAAVAVATALVMTPELSRYFHRPHANAQSAPTQVARLEPPAPTVKPAAITPPRLPENIAGNDAGSNLVSNPPADDNQVAQADNDDGRAVISDLQSDSPSVAVWTAPDNKTTVVWVPDQQP
jgi:hypothetical protein